MRLTAHSGQGPGSSTMAMCTASNAAPSTTRTTNLAVFELIIRLVPQAIEFGELQNQSEL